jgi:Fe2+ transport system protein FeoA
MKLLSQLSIGESATVIAVNGEGAIRRRLFDMGITPGVDVYLRKKAPLGDPIEISLRGYELTLRKAEASLVEVK